MKPSTAAVPLLALAALGALAQTPTLSPPAPAGADGNRAAEVLAAAFKRADANGDGRLSREESARMPAIADRFDSYDKDGDGLLTLEELSAAMLTK